MCFRWPRRKISTPPKNLLLPQAPLFDCLTCLHLFEFQPIYRLKQAASWHLLLPLSASAARAVCVVKCRAPPFRRRTHPSFVSLFRPPELAFPQFACLYRDTHPAIQSGRYLPLRCTSFLGDIQTELSPACACFRSSAASLSLFSLPSVIVPDLKAEIESKKVKREGLGSWQ